MKNLKFISLILLSSILFAACAPEAEPDVSAEEIVKEGIDNMAKVKSASYAIELNGKFINKDPYVEFEEMDIDAIFNGQFDFNDLKDSKFSLIMELLASLDGSSEQNMNAEMLITDNNLYFAINDISNFDGELPIEMIEPFFSQWWYIPIPEESLSALEIYYDDEEEYLTEEEKQIKELFSETNMLKDLKYKGDEKVEGMETYHYTASLDEDAVKDYIIDSAEIMGEEISEYDIEDVEEFLENVDVDLDLYITKDDTTLIKIGANADISDPGVMTLEMKGSYTLSDLNDGVELNAPSDATMFDPFALMMGASALAAPEDMYGDDLMLDAYSEEDFADFSY